MRSLRSCFFSAFAALVLVGLQFAAPASGQAACVPYPTEFTTCAGIDHPVYLADGANLVEIETSLAMQKVGLTSATKGCYEAIMPYLCGLAFPQCLELPDPVPNRVCESTCLTAATACASDIAVLKQLGIEFPPGTEPTPAYCVNGTIPGTETRVFSSDTATCDTKSTVNVAVSAPQCELAGFLFDEDTSCCVGPESLSACEPYEGEICKGLLPWAESEDGPGLYITDSTDPTESQAAKEQGLRGLLKLLALLDFECYEYAMQFFCLASFVPCGSATLSKLPVPINVPVLPCQSICSTTLGKCAADLERLVEAGIEFPTNPDGTSIIPTCEETLDLPDTIPPVAQFPEDGETVVLPAPIPLACLGLDYGETTCESTLNADGQLENRAAIPPKQCPEPLLLNVEGTACELACPSPFFDEDEYDVAIDMMAPMAWFSFLGSCVVIATWMLFKEKRQFPSILILYLSICTFWAGIGLIMSSTGNYKEIWCKDPTTYWEQSMGGTCVASAMFIYYFGFAGSLWWFTIGLNLYMAVVREHKSFGDYMKYFHAVNWSVPMVGLIANLSAEQFGYGFGVWCFIVDKWWQYFSFYIPISILIVLDIGMACMVTHKIWTITRGTGTGSKLSIAKQIRPLAFVFSFSLVFFIIVAYRFDIGENEDALADSIADFVICNAKGEANCSYSTEPDYGLFMTNVFFVNTLGILVFLFFGATKATWGAWKTGVNGSLTRLSRNSRGSKSTPRGSQSSSSRNVELSRQV